MDPRASVNGCGNYRPHRDSIPGSSSQQGVAIPTEPSRTTMLIIILVIIICSIISSSNSIISIVDTSNVPKHNLFVFQ